MNLTFTILFRNRTFIALFPLVLSLLLSHSESQAQPVTVDPGFVENLNPSITISPSVLSISLQADGKVLVGGQTVIKTGPIEAYPIRLHANGAIDTGFNPKPDGQVKAVAVQEDGRILLAGEFTTVNAQYTKTYGGLVRLNTNGTTDTSFDPAIQGMLSAVCLQPDGKILISGEIYSVEKKIARLHPNGALDDSFNSAVNGTIHALVLQPDGSIVIGGEFTEVGGMSRLHLARLKPDGSLDSQFQANADETVCALAADENGQTLVAGSFNWIAGQPRSRIARLNTSGSLDEFSPSVDATIRALAVELGGRILIGGDFGSVAGQPRARMARLNHDGTLDQEFQADADAAVLAIAPQLDGKILLGGDFTQVQSQARSNIARLLNPATPTRSLQYTNGTIRWLRGGSGPEAAWAAFDFSTNLTGWTRLETGRRTQGGWILEDTPLSARAFIRARGFVSTGNSGWFEQSVVLPLNDPYITSHPTNRMASLGQTVTFSVGAGGTAPFTFQWRRNGVALPDATNATLFLTSLQGTNAGHYDVVVSNAVGSMTSFSGFLTVNSVLPDSSFAPNAAGADVRVLAVQPDGNILVGGYLNTLNGTARVGLGRLTTNGSIDASFGNPAVNGSVLTAMVQDDGRVLIGGDFTHVDGEPVQFLCRLNTNGTRDLSFNPSPNNVVQVLATQPDGKILVGGNFSSVGGVSRLRLARLHPDGTLDAGFNPGANGPVYTFATLPDQKIVVGGAFTELAGIARNHIGCLDFNGALISETNPGADDDVYVITPQPDGRLLVGGAFTTLGGQARNRFGRLNQDGTVDVDFNTGATGGSFPAVLALAAQVDGSVVVGGWFTAFGNLPRTNLARCLPDGSVDGTFAPAVVGAVNAVTMQADGQILLGGTLTRLGGQVRNRLGRLSNSGFASSMVNVSDTTATWMRKGTGPELQRATVAVSTNNQEWESVEASRIAGGWQATGLSLPPESTVRVRGYVSAGFQNTSGSVVEAITNIPPLAP